MTKTLYSVICQFTGELIAQYDDVRRANRDCDDYNIRAEYDQFIVVKSTNGRQS